ncbi:Hypothetical protein R9X50_00604900 [Acrodontium crateriforme]|uniref:Lipocalin-like domain-containing protein n=1 Tax=Acrodontium crateriforme TaxID=150365 RepID=A0AAQ3MAF2_9PEZI|nr:Hypothetical protein R9X50_00604900 [Acrodontium crateriforme]
MAPVVIRPPTFSSGTSHADFKSPTIAFLTGVWHVTHSTLPMWKTKRNVRIQYTPLQPSTSALSKENTDRIDDRVTYQALGSTKLQTISGVDTLAEESGEGRSEWNWRGNGLLRIASSHWEILGWGDEEGTGNKWVVTCFAQTLFTPAGLDVYSQSPKGIQKETLQSIKAALAATGDDSISTMASTLFEVQIDDDRND